MRLYTPDYKPGDIVGFKNGDDFVIAKVEYVRFCTGLKLGDEWRYDLGQFGVFSIGYLYDIPLARGTKFDV